MRWDRDTTDSCSWSFLTKKQITPYAFAIKKFFLRFLNKELPTQYNRYIATVKGLQKRNIITDRLSYFRQIYSKKCSFCHVKNDILHISNSCRTNQHLQREKIHAVQTILNTNLGRGKILAKDWLVDDRFNNLANLETMSFKL